MYTGSVLHPCTFVWGLLIIACPQVYLSQLTGEMLQTFGSLEPFTTGAACWAGCDHSSGDLITISLLKSVFFFFCLPCHVLPIAFQFCHCEIMLIYTGQLMSLGSGSCVLDTML